MKNNIFELETEELKAIADSLQGKIEEGLKKDGMEILAIPTHINPKKDIPDGKVLALDWGGTNFRAAIVEFKNGKPIELKDEDIQKLKLNAETTDGFTRDDLFSAMAGAISKLKDLDNSVTRIGYCFSYPTASRLNGDAILLRWTKGINISGMVGEPVGEPFLRYINSHKDIKTKFTDIKVVNDTITCLFAGMNKTDHNYGSYISLIVGTGTNMAALVPLDKIEKLNDESKIKIPVNLESGNFNPPYLTIVDGLVDAMSNNKGQQRFEKAISGGYLGEMFKTYFMYETIKYDFDGGDLAGMINNPKDHPAEQVGIAKAIYDRSAKLVAASLSGLLKVIAKKDPEAKNICLAADGSVFWSKDNNGGTPHKNLVEKELNKMLPEGVSVTVVKVEDTNLIGGAIAALSPSGKIVYN